MSALPSMTPPITAETRFYWSQAAAGRLVLKHCDDCDQAFWYPRSICPLCHSQRTSWRPASGRGIVYTFTIVRRAQGAWSAAVPFALAVVELAEGPKIITNIVGCDPARVSIGAEVEVVFDPAGDESALVRFRLAAATEEGLTT